MHKNGATNYESIKLSIMEYHSLFSNRQLHQPCAQKHQDITLYLTISTCQHIIGITRTLSFYPIIIDQSHHHPPFHHSSRSNPIFLPINGIATTSLNLGYIRGYHTYTSPKYIQKEPNWSPFMTPIQDKVLCLS